jgi:hypothetical protein
MVLDEGIQGNPRIFFLVFLGFPWPGLVGLAFAWEYLGLGIFGIAAAPRLIACLRGRNGVGSAEIGAARL